MADMNNVFARSYLRPSIACSLSLILAAVCLSSIAAFPTDDWKNKDPQVWDQKDVQKILNDSPWAKQLQFGIGPDGSLSSNVASVGSSGVSETSGSGAGGVKGLGGGRTTGESTSAPVPTASGGPVAKFTICWRSSITVREALVREKELSHLLPDEARKDLATKYDSYQIAITGGDLRAFSKEGAETLKTRSYLLTKSTKQIISPSKMVIQTRQDGSPVAVVFDFPKKNAAGEVTIAPNEKSVEFGARAGGMPIRATFEFSKMSVNGGPDL